MWYKKIAGPGETVGCAPAVGIVGSAMLAVVPVFDSEVSKLI
jgi:hypothetical protein